MTMMSSFPVQFLFFTALLSFLRSAIFFCFRQSSCRIAHFFSSNKRRLLFAIAGSSFFKFSDRSSKTQVSSIFSYANLLEIGFFNAITNNSWINFPHKGGLPQIILKTFLRTHKTLPNLPLSSPYSSDYFADLPNPPNPIFIISTSLKIPLDKYLPIHFFFLHYTPFSHQCMHPWKLNGWNDDNSFGISRNFRSSSAVHATTPFKLRPIQ